MRFIKSFKIFENKFNNFPKTKEEVESICSDLQNTFIKLGGIQVSRLKVYHINDDLSVDVLGSVFLDNMNITKLPLIFNRVSGDFNISYNPNLSNLDGFPNYIGANLHATASGISEFKRIVHINGDCNITANKLMDPIDLNNLILSVHGSLYRENNPISVLCNKLIYDLNITKSYKERWFEILDRLIEFNVIDGNNIDIIRLNQLYDFYGVHFDEELFKFDMRTNQLLFGYVIS